MMKNKKSQMIMAGIMMAIIVLIFATQIITPVKEVVVDARSPEKMNCTSDTISDGTLGACILIDWSPFYYFGTMLFVGIGFITLRKLKIL